MIRSEKMWVFIVAVAAAGVVVGWVMGAVISPLPASPVEPDAPGQGVVEKPKSTKGFCCLVAGEKCRQMPGPVDCFRQNGRAFNGEQARCDLFCSRVQP